MSRRPFWFLTRPAGQVVLGGLAGSFVFHAAMTWLIFRLFDVSLLHIGALGNYALSFCCDAVCFMERPFVRGWATNSRKCFSRQSPG